MTSDPVSLLLVDDIPENLLALEATLAPLGHRIVTARSGEEALRQLLKVGDFAVVILDVQMPGMDGFETALAIRQRERSSEVPILFLTAISRDDHHRLEGFAAGGTDYMFKPVDPAVLRAKVAVLVRIHTSDRELRRRQEELRLQAADLARSNADLDQFASVVSHDLVEPLNVITGYLELLSARLSDKLDEDTCEWIGRINTCAEHMSGLIGDLLGYSRALAEGEAAAERVTTDLGDSLADATENLEAALSATGSRLDVPNALPVVCGTRRELAQIFQNLVGNSIRHAGGRPVCVTVTAEEKGGSFDVVVSDDGPGLPAVQMQRVFGMFERSTSDDPTPGTGLGLAICRRIVNRLGGAIRMEPNPSAGVRVVFTLPRPGPM
jgi:two-component system sensor histidine kinase/response regulator